MGNTATNGNSTQYYGGSIYSSLTSHEECITFHQYFEKIEFVLKLQVYEDNQGAITLAVAP